MSDWHPPLIARIGLRLLGLGLLASLRWQAPWLHALVLRTSVAPPLAALLAACCFISASLGAALMLMGPDLWRPVRLTPQWSGWPD